MPRGGPVDSIYRQSLLAARNRSGALSRATQTRILRGYAESLTRLDIAEAAGRITAERAAELHAQISSALYSFNDQFDRTVGGGIRTTINDVVREHDRALQTLSDDFGVRARGSFDNIDVEVALNLAMRRGADSFTSLMKYRLDNNVIPQIDSFLSSAVQRGVSVSETTQDLVRLLANGDENLNRALDLVPRGANISRFGVMTAVDLEKYGIDPQHASAIRSLFADSRRIAVSEINNTLRETNATAMTMSPVVEAATWSRSGAHEGPCECDVLAETDFYGYGPGAYPPDKWPMAPHPNCGCYQGGPMVYRSPKDWGKVKPPSPPIQRDPTNPSIFQRFGFSDARSSRASSNVSSALGEGEMRSIMVADAQAHPMLPGESKLDYQKRRKRERAAARKQAKASGQVPPKTKPLPNPTKTPKIDTAPLPSSTIAKGDLPKLRKAKDFEDTGTWEFDYKGRKFEIYRDPENGWWYEAPGRTGEHHSALFRGFNREEALRRQLAIADDLPPIKAPAAVATKPPPTSIGNPKQLPGESKAEFQKRRRRERAQARKAAASGKAPKISPSKGNYLDRLNDAVDGSLSKTQFDDITDAFDNLPSTASAAQIQEAITTALVGKERASLYKYFVNEKQKETRAFHRTRRKGKKIVAEIHLSPDVTQELQLFFESYKRGTLPKSYKSFDPRVQSIQGFRTAVHESLHGMSFTADEIGGYGLPQHRFIEEGLVERRARRTVARFIGVKDDTFFGIYQGGSYHAEVTVMDVLAKRFGEKFLDDVFRIHVPDQRVDMIFKKVGEYMKKKNISGWNNYFGWRNLPPSRYENMLKNIQQLLGSSYD